MKRKAVHQLINWKSHSTQHPLCISGPKGIGKTYLVLDFAKSFFEGNLYINFETNAKLCYFFEQHRTEDFLKNLKSYYQLPELLSDVVYLIDELWACPCAYHSFLEFLRTNPSISIILITSKEGIFSGIEYEFIEKLQLFPLDFEEFLIANGAEWYTEIIRGHCITGKKIPEIVHRELLKLFEDYLEVGGMPAAVKEYLNFESTENVMEIHRILYQSMCSQIKKMYPEQEAFKMNQILDILVEQLLKENPKFQYRLIRKGATRMFYETAMNHLEENRIIYSCKKIKEKEKIDLTSKQLYYMDTGIFYTMLFSNSDNCHITENIKKKAVLKNFVAQTLAKNLIPFYYWESDGKARIHFIVKKEEEFFPIELYTQEHTYSKSTSVFRQHFLVPFSISLSKKNFEISNNIKQYPYYSLSYLLER